MKHKEKYVNMTPAGVDFVKFLERMSGRNKEGYDFINDKFLVDYCIRALCVRCKPLVLSKQQQELLRVHFEKVEDMQTAYRIIEKLRASIFQIFMKWQLLYVKQNCKNMAKMFHIFIFGVVGRYKNLKHINCIVCIFY